MFCANKKPPRNQSGVAKVQGGGADLQHRRTGKGGEMPVLLKRWGLMPIKSIAEMYFSVSERQKAPRLRANVIVYGHMR
jgi:hypothetical protein